MIEHLVSVTAGGPWAESPVATGNTKDTDRWVKVEVPTDDGKIVQVSAGEKSVTPC